jgi:hypothetical protein
MVIDFDLDSDSEYFYVLFFPAFRLLFLLLLLLHSIEEYPSAWCSQVYTKCYFQLDLFIPPNALRRL